MATTDDEASKRGRSDTDDEPVKRKRVSRACLQCRSRKIKCDGQTPQCKCCATAGHECSYGVARRRGLVPGYIQNLEAYCHEMEQLLGCLVDTTPNGNALLSTVAATRESNDGSQDYASAWRHSTVYKELKKRQPGNDEVSNTVRRRLVTTGKVSEMGGKVIDGSPDNGGSGDGNGPGAPGRAVHATTTTEADIKLPLQQQLSTQPLPNMSTGNVVFTTPGTKNSSALGKNELVRHHFGPSSCYSADFHPDVQSFSARGDLGAFLASVPIADRLKHLDSYMSYVHCWLPMANKTELMREMYRTEEFGGTPRELLLCAVLLVSHTTSSSGDFANTDELLHDLVARILSAVIVPVQSLELVQATVLTALMLLAKGHWNTAWFTIGVAVKSARLLQLPQFFETPLGHHAVGAPASATATKHTFEQRTWYACCIVDTLISARLGQVPLVRESDFEVAPLDESVGEEWETWKPDDQTQAAAGARPQWPAEPARSISVYNSLFRLVQLLNSFVAQVNQLDFATRPEAHKSMFCNDLTAKLQMWSRNLPEHCSLSDFSMRVSQPLPPHKINLYLTLTTTASCFYVMNDLRHITPDFFFPNEILPSMTAKLIANFRARLPPAKAPFMFEYFCSVSLALTLNNRLMDRNTPSITHSMLNDLAATWEGAAFSKLYFSKARYPPPGGVGHTLSEPHALTSALEEFATAASIEASLAPRLDVIHVCFA